VLQALDGIPESERCAGWQVGVCAQTIEKACPDCGSDMNAPDEETMAEVAQYSCPLSTSANATRVPFSASR
jgi:predicted RNA-binding Zn-ribbon protein involved in translation (DUF1610 family)